MIIHEPSVSYIRKNVPTKVMDDAEKSAEAFRNHAMENKHDPSLEYFTIALLNRKNNVLAIKTIAMGGITSCVADIRIIFKECFLHNATALIVSHSHPSGDPTPSSADTNMTRKIREAAQLLEITFLDHIVMGEKENDPTGLGYYSYRAAGLI